MSKKILMLVGDFVEDYEAMVPFQALLSVGCKVHVVCPDKKSGNSVATAVHDNRTGYQTYVELRGHNFVLNATFNEINPDEYDGLYICGGRAPEYIRLHERVLSSTQYFFKANKPVAAICHGIQILTAADVVRGRTLTAYPTIGPDITRAGGTYKSIPADEALVDGNLVTSPGWTGHPRILQEFYNMLGITITDQSTTAA